MKIVRFAPWLIAVALLNFFAISKSMAASANSDWRLVWSDEFDQSGSLDQNKWGFEIGGDGWGNGELQYYTDRLDNARVEDGHLILEMRKEEYENNQYTSARIFSLSAWTYGRIEIRAKLAGGNGSWPAFWMLPTRPRYGNGGWPDNGEIDVMEYAGHSPDQVLGSFYSKNHIWYHDTGISAWTTVANAETEFHVYALEWSEDSVALSVDGQVYNVFQNPHTSWEDWPYDQDNMLIMNVAVGGGFGGDVDDSIFPRQTVIDYVRVYQPSHQARRPPLHIRL